MDRKKELKLQYKQMKSDMGIFIIRSKVSNKCHIEATQDLRGTMNGTSFKLEAGGYPNRELQREWNDLGKESFTIEIIENLKYDEDESKTDYGEDLTLLKMLWEEKLVKENMEFYKR